jgi:hypothetical protein
MKTTLEHRKKESTKVLSNQKDVLPTYKEWKNKGPGKYVWCLQYTLLSVTEYLNLLAYRERNSYFMLKIISRNLS